MSLDNQESRTGTFFGMKAETKIPEGSVVRYPCCGGWEYSRVTKDGVLPVGWETSPNVDMHMLEADFVLEGKPDLPVTE